MNIALFGKQVSESNIRFVQDLVTHLDLICDRILIYSPFYEGLKGVVDFPKRPVLFSGQEGIREQCDFLFTIGGDGTILDAMGIVGDSGIPVMGINLGRLGFLSSISKEDVTLALAALKSGKFSVEPRTLLQLHTSVNLFGSLNFALNDVTVYKPNAMSLLTIKTWVNGTFLNSYWADGLIVATPTGSTAYSLSCTGPIITPDSENFLITPVASHNLTVRPIVIRDDSEIRIRVVGKEPGFLVSMDSRTISVEDGVELRIAKASFKINLIRLSGDHFFRTIREKLNWGLDNRNYQGNS